MVSDYVGFLRLDLRNLRKPKGVIEKVEEDDCWDGIIENEHLRGEIGSMTSAWAEAQILALEVVLNKSIEDEGRPLTVWGIEAEDGMLSAVYGDLAVPGRFVVVRCQYPYEYIEQTEWADGRIAGTVVVRLSKDISAFLRAGVES